METTVYDFDHADSALVDLAHDRVTRAAVLRVRPVEETM